MYKALAAGTHKAFTLIELLIVIAIIAILTVAFLPVLRGGQTRARDSGKKAIMEKFVSVLEKAVSEARPLPDDVPAVGAAGECITTYSAGTGASLATEYGSVPENLSYPTLAAPNFCLGNQLYYNRVGATSQFILGIQMETASNANVEVGQTAADIMALDTRATFLAAMDGTLPTTTDTANPFMYVLAKFDNN